MNMNIFPRALLVPVVAVLLVSACSTVKKVAPGQDKVDYKKSKVTESLEVPPDLSSNTINDAPASLDAATYSEYGNSRTDIRDSARRDVPGVPRVPGSGAAPCRPRRSRRGPAVRRRPRRCSSAALGGPSPRPDRRALRHQRGGRPRRCASAEM